MFVWIERRDGEMAEEERETKKQKTKQKNIVGDKNAKEKMYEIYCRSRVNWER